MSQPVVNEVYDFFRSKAAKDFFRSTFPTLLDLYDYDKRKYHDKVLRAKILSECTHHLPIPGYTSFSKLSMLDREAAEFLRDQLILRSRWWFRNYVPYDEYWED